MAAECSAPGGAAFKVWRLSFCLSCVILLTHPQPPTVTQKVFCEKTAAGEMFPE